MNFLVRFGIALFITHSLGHFASAAPSSLTYQGRILKSDGTALEHNNVSFQFEVTSPDGLCVIYREQVNGINMVNSKGIFDVPIGTIGAQSYPGNGVFTLLDSFVNTGTLDCDGGAHFSPQFDDGRKLRVKFHDGVGWRIISPDSTIRSVPYAGYAYSAAKLGTNVSSDFLLKAGLPICPANTFLTWSGSAFSCIGVTGASGGTVTDVTSKNSYLTIINNSISPELTLNVGTSANTVAAGNDSRFTDARTPTGGAGGDLSGTYPNPSVVKIQGIDIANAVPTAGQILKFTASKWTASTMDMSDVSNLTTTLSGYQTQAAFNTALGSANCAANETFYWSSVSGKFLCQSISLSLAGDISGAINNVSVDKIKSVPVDATAPTLGQVLKYDGAKWSPMTLAGSGVTSVSSANSFLTVTSATTTPSLTVNVGTSANTLAAGNDSRIVNAIQNSGNASSIVVNTFANKPAVGSIGQIYISNDTGAIFVGTGAGWKVVGSSDAGFISSGTLAIGSGGTGATTKVGAFNNLSPLTTKGDLVGYDGTNNIRLPAGTNGQVLTADSTAATGFKWATNSSNGFVNGGNSFGAAANLGTNDSYALNIKTAGTTRMNFDTTGRIGMGIAADSGATLIVKSLNTSDVPLMVDSPTGGIPSIDFSVNSGATWKGTLGFASNGSPNDLYISNGTASGNLIFDTANNEKMRITAAGNVGIGSSSPSSKLTVAGTIESTSGGMRFPDSTTQDSSAFGPVFSVYASSSPSTVNSSWIKIPFNTVEIDTDSIFIAGSNRIRPNRAGYYQITLHQQLSQVATAGHTNYVGLYKNGSLLKATSYLVNYTASFVQTAEVNALVYFNGTSDYIEGFFTTNHSSNAATATAGVANGYLSGHFVRP